MKYILIPLLILALLGSTEVGVTSEPMSYSLVVTDTVVTVEYDTLYKNVIGTVYHPVKRQTDNTPFVTADSSIIDKNRINELRWIALSRDLIYSKSWGRDWDGKVLFGDTVEIVSPYSEINGEWVVHDTMNKRYKKRLDFLQKNKNDGIYGKWRNIMILKPIKHINVVKRIVNIEKASS
jgi:hypothetical protein